MQHTDSDGHEVECNFFGSASIIVRQWIITGVIMMSAVHLYTIATVQCGIPNMVNKNFSLEAANTK